MDYMSLKYNHDGGDYMNMQEIKILFKESGLIENPHTHKWIRGSINSSHGELPTTFMSEEKCNERVWHGNIYIRKKVD